MTIRYATWETAPAEYEAAVLNLIGRGDVKSVCEVGAGANPMLDLDTVNRHGLRYLVVDSSALELQQASDSYQKLVANWESPSLDLGEGYDLIISKFVLEHVRDPARFHMNVLRTLTRRGHALHFFSTLFAPPFVLNRVLPETVGQPIVARLFPGRHGSGQQEKFRAYYRWCRGPSARQQTRFTRLGFVLEEYVGYFGHPYYDWLTALRPVERKIARLLVRHPVDCLTSYAFVHVQRA